MVWVEIFVVLASIVLGLRFGGIAIGLFGGLGLVGLKTTNRICSNRCYFDHNVCISFSSNIASYRRNGILS